MNVEVKQWGNGLGLLIPPELATIFDIKESTQLEITAENDHVILRKQSKSLTLEDILASFPENYQYPDDIADFINGPIVGREII